MLGTFEKKAHIYRFKKATHYFPSYLGISRDIALCLQKHQISVVIVKYPSVGVYIHFSIFFQSYQLSFVLFRLNIFFLTAKDAT